MSKPRILITLDHSYGPSECIYINLSYLTAIERAGGTPVLVGRPDKEEVARLIASCDAVFLTGGDDVIPELYGAVKSPLCGKIDPSDRDRVEWDILDHAYARKLPILGVCRGMQVMNAHLGGTLYQDIEGEMANACKHDFHKDENSNKLRRDFPAHDMHIIPDTLLHNIVGENKISVNSLHHQGVRDLAQKFKKCGTAPDGLIEAIEHLEHPFCIGVQWHPEELGDAPSQKLFQALVFAARSQEAYLKKS